MKPFSTLPEDIGTFNSKKKTHQNWTKNKKFTLIPNTVDSRYLEFDGTMEKI